MLQIQYGGAEIFTDLIEHDGAGSTADQNIFVRVGLEKVPEFIESVYHSCSFTRLSISIWTRSSLWSLNWAYREITSIYWLLESSLGS